MGIEIERRYLLRDEDWRENARTVACRQGYLSCGPPTAVRVRIMDEVATINAKRLTTKISREEYEYQIPLDDAHEILDRLCVGCVIEKKRHYVEFEGFTWEIDEYEAANAGLVTAELEITHEDQQFPLPPWLGDEISDDLRYLNSSLAQHPYSEWGCA